MYQQKHWNENWLPAGAARVNCAKKWQIYNFLKSNTNFLIIKTNEMSLVSISNMRNIPSTDSNTSTNIYFRMIYSINSTCQK